ncbi:MAG: hypothetical protein JW895_08680 [Thermoleophilaceae bacterium]|nr:hypothetical protein [Thermoleophilaceae bacterium]
MSGHGIRWWQPGIRYAAQRDVAGAIYGLILATSVIAVSQQYEPHNSGVTAVTVIVTALVFWLAHVYTKVMAVGVREHHTPTWAEVRHVLDEEWPLVQAGLLPTTVLLLGPLGILADDAAQDIAIGVCLMELGLTGLVVARAAGARGLLVGVSAAISVSFGVIVIVLKTIVH